MSTETSAVDLAGYTIDDLKRIAVLQSLDRHNGHYCKVAEELGVHRETVSNWAERYKWVPEYCRKTRQSEVDSNNRDCKPSK